MMDYFYSGMTDDICEKQFVGSKDTEYMVWLVIFVDSHFIVDWLRGSKVVPDGVDT